MRPLSKAQLFAFWRRRFTDQEIREMAAALDSLAIPDHSTFARPQHRERRRDG